ncbi:MAG: Phenolpthiocerol synthesis type-I polyketide synthase ppsC, partial [Mycobacterium sp.]|nr:Phenolpthiocerol synthesis type-I polyketide synthase ppsC [Mycobacterium sp.]
LVLGSVKTNLGHLESAAGIAGFIKTVLSLRYGYIPKHLHFEQLTPHASEGASEFTIASNAMEWPTAARARRAGVSSFGVSGTNAHVVIEQAPAPEPVVWEPDPVVTTLVVSGKSPERIASMAGALADWMAGPGAGVGLTDVAHALNHHRARHPKFATVCARDRAEAISGLEALAAKQAAVGLVAAHEGPCRPGTVFVYSGQGSQWAGMGRQLLADEPAFAAAIAELEPVFVEHVGFSLQQILADGQTVTGIDRIQPVLVGLQLALTELWRSYGVTPDAVIGHSMGEVSAAVVAGALTPAEGLQVIANRSRLMSRLAGQGAMALLELDAEATGLLIADHPDVTLAVYASPGQTVIAGPPTDIDTLIAAVAKQSRLARRIDVDVASHHPTIDPVLSDLRAALANLASKSPTIPIISTAYDHTVTPAPTFDADYWVTNVRQPVRFSQAISIVAADHGIFIEVSPHPLLAHAIDDTVADVHHHSVATLQRDTHDTHTFHTNLNITHTVQAPDTPHPPEPHPALPTTPWHHTSHWIGGSPGARRTKRGIANEWDSELTWPVRPLTAVEAAGDGSWLVLADADLGAEIGRVLGEDSSVTVLTPSVLADEADGAALLDLLGGASNVLYAPDVSAGSFGADSGFRLFDAAKRLTAAFGVIASPPRLHMLTDRSTSEDDHADPARAVLWAVARTLATQHSGIWGGIVDFDDSDSTVPEDIDGGASLPAGEIKEMWRDCEPETRRDLLRGHVGMLVAAVMGLPPSQSLNPTADFFELGMDSLMNVLLQRALTETLGEVLPQSIVFDYPTVEELADYLVTIPDGDQSGATADEDLTESDLSEKVG